MRFEKLDMDEDSKGLFLYRYVSEDKLADFLESRQLYLTRMDRFNDGLEGATPYEVTELAVFLNPLPVPKDRSPIITSNQWKDIEAQSKYAIQHHRNVITKRQKERFVSCWFMGDEESYAMWDLYSPQGFLVKISYEVFRESIESYHQEVASEYSDSDHLVMGKVTYQGFDKIIKTEEQSLMKYSGFRKHLGFKHEEEFRLILHSKSGEDFLRFKLPEVFFNNLRVYASPYFSDSEFQRRKEVLVNTYSKVLQQSTLTKWMRFKEKKTL